VHTGPLENRARKTEIGAANAHGICTTAHLDALARQLWLCTTMIDLLCLAISPEGWIGQFARKHDL
jgi:hypothetical protein